MIPLHYVQKGPPINKYAIFIIHGLFGSLENLNSISTELSQLHPIISVDCRNHGKSPKTNTMTYIDMSKDIESLYQALNLSSCDIIGHSMGGKIAMCTSLRNKININNQIIIDISPKKYPLYHTPIINALIDVDLTKYTSRSDVSRACEQTLPNAILRQFLMKNVERTDKGLEWKINLPAIQSNYPSISSFPESLQQNTSETNTLMIYGTQSNYVTLNDHQIISKMFPNTTFHPIDASHWVHAEKPNETIDAIQTFIQSRGCRK